MDTDRQLYEREASGWRAGIYEDVQATFRAPIVNWIFRTLMANDAEFTRSLWGQVKPAFETRAFGRYSIAYRGAVRSAFAERDDVPVYRRSDLDLAPAEFRELRGQVATFDVVAPRLAALFEVVDRSLQGKPIGTALDEGEHTATEPLPVDLDRDRGLSPTMVDADGVPDELDGTVDRIRAFHGLDDGLPSIYRCLAQWPAYLGPAWDALEPALESSAFERACEDARAETETFAESLAYPPRLSPDDLRARGMDDEEIDALRELFATFNRGPIETVLPALHVYAATLGVGGRRRLS